MKCECCGSKKGLVREMATANIYCLACSQNTCDTCHTLPERKVQQIEPHSRTMGFGYKMGADGYNNKRKW